MVRDGDDIKYSMRKLADEATGLMIKYKKTKYLAMEGQSRDLNIQRHTTSKCEEDKYVASIIPLEGNLKFETIRTKRDRLEKESKLNSLLWFNNLKKRTKDRIYNSIIQTI